MSQAEINLLAWMATRDIVTTMGGGLLQGIRHKESGPSSFSHYRTNSKTFYGLVRKGFIERQTAFDGVGVNYRLQEGKS